MSKNRYRSKIEGEIAKQLRNNKISFDYEPSWGKVVYTVPSKNSVYNPDFYITTRTGKTIIIEVKGIWVYEDRYKHLLLRQQHPELDIRFVFSSSKNRIRKGSKTTYRDICEGKGRGPFKGVVWHYADKKIPKEWLEE
jgi:predicted nuclease of restriction endonuclease-like RecB superfamily